MRETFNHQCHMFVWHKLRLVSLWYSTAFHTLIVIWSNTLPGCASFHGFADRVWFSLVNVSWAKCGFFGVFGPSWRFGRDYRLTLGLKLLGFWRLLFDRRFNGWVLLGRFDRFRWLYSLHRQFGIGLGLVIINSLTDFRGDFFGWWLCLLFKVIICIIIILKIILPILLILFLFSRFNLGFYWLNGLWLCFSDSVRGLCGKYLLTVFWLVLVINRLLQRFFKFLFVKLIIVIVLLYFLFVVYLIWLRYW